ncbi:MAG TPA: hypothetical protein PK536_12995 [Ignavibacteria bacterium]|nr:hypothetical protein [Ignavibacteria bacterium]HRJ99934.1 hypothetical protein [Ignavibacteria bacterium]
MKRLLVSVNAARLIFILRKPEFAGSVLPVTRCNIEWQSVLLFSVKKLWNAVNGKII